MILDSEARMTYMQVNRSFSIEGFNTPFEYLWDDKFVFNGESHSAWEIVFVDDGKIEVTEDENVYVLEKNEIIFHAPNEFHRIKSYGGTSPHVFIMSFEAEGDLPPKLRDGVFKLSDEESAEHIANFKKIRELRNGSTEVFLSEEAAAGMSLFFIKLAKRGCDSGACGSVSALEYKRLISSMTAGVAKNLSLDELAKENNVSVSYVKYLFSKYAGESPKQYYITLRLRKAEELLRAGASVKEIVSAMNFSSSAYFSAFFKRETGKTPMEYLSMKQ